MVTPQPLLHHRTIQVAGNRVQPAVVHTLVFGIHRHKNWHTAVITVEARAAAAAAAHHRSRPHPRHQLIQPSNDIVKLRNSVIGM